MQQAPRTLDRRCMGYIYNRLSRVEHLHSRFELLVPRRGEVHVRLNEQKQIVHPGEMLVLFPGVLHVLEPEADCEGVMFFFYTEHLSEMGESLGAMQPVCPVVRFADVHEDVHYCLRRLTEMAETGKTDEMLASSYLTLMFLHLMKRLELVQSDPAAAKDLLYRAMQYISQNLASSLNLKGTARALGVNSYYLSHVLSERIHMGFRAYLNALRVERARRYLRLTPWPVEEIAAACGFNTLRTFDRVFMEYCGCTPREFRKAHALGQTKKQNNLPVA